jgi:L-threonylcarbamoyladenylate synthase
MSGRPAISPGAIASSRDVSDAEAAIAAIRAEGLAIVPTDTVYGLATSAHSEAAARRLYRAKGRDEIQPTAILVADVESLLELVPEIGSRDAAVARALLPGGFTLILLNPARRFPWLTGARPETIGLRVPAVAGPGKAVLEGIGAMVATSANLPGGHDPRRLADVPRRLLDAADAVVDGGELPGTASTVIDFTGPEPVVVREGAEPSAEALRVVGRVV